MSPTAIRSVSADNVHRIAIEFGDGREPILIDCADAEHVRRCVEAAENDPGAHYIFYLVKSAPDSGWSTVRLSFVREAESGKWRIHQFSKLSSPVVIFEGGSGEDG